MISVNTEALFETAKMLSEQADNIDKFGSAFECAAREERAQKKILVIFKRSESDINKLAAQRKAIVNKLRAKSLFLRECAKRFKNAQSVTLNRQWRLR